MTINPATGAISWTPTEAQGPSTNAVSVSVTDNGVPALSVTNTFTVIVNEVNNAPVLTVPANQTINEQTTLNVSASDRCGPAGQHLDLCPGEFAGWHDHQPGDRRDRLDADGGTGPEHERGECECDGQRSAGPERDQHVPGDRQRGEP